MSQLDTPAAWRKAHRRRLSLVGLGQLELLLLLVLDTVGVRDETRTVAGDVRPDVGWATRDDGRPLSRRELAALCRLAPGAAGLAELAAAVDGLVELGHVVVADDGAVGVSAWAELQESPDALRKRDKRRTPPGHSAECPPQKTEDRRQNSIAVSTREAGTPPASGRTLGQRLRLARESAVTPLSLRQASARAGLDVEDLRRFEDDTSTPTRTELRAMAKVYGDPAVADLELPEQDEGLAGAVAREHHDLKLELGLASPDDPLPVVDAALVRTVNAPRETEGKALADTWRTVLRRGAERVRRDGGRGRAAEFYRLDILAKPGERKRLLDTPDLDRRLDEQPRRPQKQTGPRNNELAPRVRRFGEDEET